MAKRTQQGAKTGGANDHMTKKGSHQAVAGSGEIDELLRRLESSKAGLIELLENCNAEWFGIEDAEGESIKKTLERASDDVNFYYGRLVARAVNLPQTPCLATAEFSSLREAVMALQIAHRRFSTLLHDLTQEDLGREAVDAEHGTYTLRQVLEMAAAHYDLRGRQVERIAAKAGA